MLTSRYLRQVLDHAERASAVEMPQEIYQEHLSQAMAALQSPDADPEKWPPLISSQRLQEMWMENLEEPNVVVDGDVFRDLVLQALQVAPTIH
jgi:hypothetical protein